ncbi:MAG: nucleoside triphosphate pyrophosphohydrolase [Cyclobacteriaceae bacterium]|nr:nucleoside triphosphate pyrophosphohydrolase [Cyclobacteriaceae bacterium]
MNDLKLSQDRTNTLKAFNRLLDIMDELRTQCPWDKKQTMETLRHLTIEETYELSDAILENDLKEVKNELGDLMLHNVFYARIGAEKGEFTMEEVLNSVCEKLIRRHPHIYGDVVAEDDTAVKENWEKIKLQEGRNKTVLGGVPKSLPALVKAIRIQDKARGSGFDWDNKDQVWEKVKEEMEEFQENIKSNNPSQEAITEEYGDLLFSMVNYARFINMDPEEALERTNKKFIKRFNYIERKAKEAGLTLHDMSLEEMEVYWNEAKKQ